MSKLDYKEITDQCVKTRSQHRHVASAFKQLKMQNIPPNSSSYCSNQRPPTNDLLQTPEDSKSATTTKQVVLQAEKTKSTNATAVAVIAAPTQQQLNSVDPDLSLQHISHEPIKIGETSLIPIDVLELTELFKTELPNMRLESIHRIFKTPLSSSIIVKRKSKVIGGCTYIVFAEQQILELALLAVDKEFHRCGMGSTLMNAFKGEALKLGLFAAAYGDKRAIKFFEKQKWHALKSSHSMYDLVFETVPKCNGADLIYWPESEQSDKENKKIGQSNKAQTPTSPPVVSDHDQQSKSKSNDKPSKINKKQSPQSEKANSKKANSPSKEILQENADKNNNRQVQILTYTEETRPKKHYKVLIQRKSGRTCWISIEKAYQQYEAQTCLFFAEQGQKCIVYGGYADSKGLPNEIRLRKISKARSKEISKQYGGSQKSSNNICNEQTQINDTSMQKQQFDNNQQQEAGATVLIKQQLPCNSTTGIESPDKSLAIRSVEQGPQQANSTQQAEEYLGSKSAIARMLLAPDQVSQQKVPSFGNTPSNLFLRITPSTTQYKAQLHETQSVQQPQPQISCTENLNKFSTNKNEVDDDSADVSSDSEDEQLNDQDFQVNIRAQIQSILDQHQLDYPHQDGKSAQCFIVQWAKAVLREETISKKQFQKSLDQLDNSQLMLCTCERQILEAVDLNNQQTFLQKGSLAFEDKREAQKQKILKQLENCCFL